MQVWCLLRPEEVVGSPETGVTGTREPPNLGTGNWTWFSARVACALTAKPSLQTPVLFLNDSLYSTRVGSHCCLNLSVPHDGGRKWCQPPSVYLPPTCSSPLEDARLSPLLVLKLGLYFFKLLSCKNSLCTWDTGTSLDVWPGNFRIYLYAMKKIAINESF